MKTTAIALAALMTCGVASAQIEGRNTDLSLGGISMRLGLVLPLDNRLSDFSSTFTGFGIDFKTTSPLGKNSENYISADYIFKSFGESGYALALAYNQRFYNNSMAARRSYGFVGLGVAFPDFGTSDTLAMIRGGVGIDLSEQTFVEATGTFTNSGTGGSINTIGIYFGYRF